MKYVTMTRVKRHLMSFATDNKITSDFHIY